MLMKYKIALFWLIGFLVLENNGVLCHLPNDGDTIESKSAAGKSEAELTSHDSSTKPSGGVYLEDNFDDPWLFERDWVPSKAHHVGTNPNNDVWAVQPLQGSAVADTAGVVVKSVGQYSAISRLLGHTLPFAVADTAGVVVKSVGQYSAISRLLGHTLPFGRHTLLVQFEVAVPRQQCVRLQLRLLTAAERLPLAAVDRSTPYSLLLSLDTCGDRSPLEVGWRRRDPKTGRWDERVSAPIPAPSLSDGSAHQLRLLLLTNASFQLEVDDQCVGGGSLLQQGAVRSGGDVISQPESAGGVSFQLYSPCDGVRLRSLLVASRPGHGRRAEPDPAIAKRVSPQQPSRLDRFLVYSSQRPWMIGLYVILFGIPACLLFSCCLPESLDLEAQRRKTDTSGPADNARHNGGQGPAATQGARPVTKQARRLPSSGSPHRRRVRLD